MNERETLMKQIMAYDFAAHDWNLYLDTHPDDKMGIALFKKMADKAKELKEEYVHKFGPISVRDVVSDEKWAWVNEPWPWS